MGDIYIYIYRIMFEIYRICCSAQQKCLEFLAFTQESFQYENF